MTKRYVLMSKGQSQDFAGGLNRNINKAFLFNDRADALDFKEAGDKIITVYVSISRKLEGGGAHRDTRKEA